MDVNDIPLLELFTRLRKAGLPLGIDDYQLVLQAMQAGFGIGDKATLKRLCETLWVKSTEDKRLFDYHFEQLIGTETVAKAPRKSKFDRITDYLAVVGALIVGVSIITFLVNIFFINKNQNQENNTQTSQIPAPSSTTNQTQAPQNTGVNPSPTQQIQTNQDQNQPNWSEIFQIVLRIGLVSVSGISLTAFIYKFYIWVITLFYKPTVSDDNVLQEAIPNASSSVLPAQLTQAIEDEVQVAQAVLQANSKNESISHNPFILTSEYFPVTERQMKQIWRYLRRPVREGAATELDVEATINQIGRQGLWSQPVLVPRRVNRAEMLLLIDQDGSMMPFHTLSHRLAATALRGGRLGKAGIYYFHNCPIDYLYHDPHHQQAVLFSHIVTHVCSERTAVLIFSDAGAARGGFSEERYRLTEAFLESLKQRVRYISWLNPMPRKRWLGTTAGEISLLVPMFEVSRRGLQDAIGVLRGHPTNFENRRI
ncbi:hypothetical protein [Nostoc sp.]|uniref:hypothetical protein n=1 Tax=Nostoc sp. TaxID=1180 RepID=UPI002FFBF44D